MPLSKYPAPPHSTSDAPTIKKVLTINEASAITLKSLFSRVFRSLVRGIDHCERHHALPVKFDGRKLFKLHANIAFTGNRVSESLPVKGINIFHL